MLSQSPFTIIASTARSAIGIKSMILYGRPLWRQRFRPYTLGILGLVIAVVLWGAGYKLSLYHRHTTPSSVPIAKLWIESRNASAAAASRFKTKSHLLSVSQAFIAPIQRLPRLNCAIASTLSACSRDVAYLGFLIPFRSPPPHRFFFA
jgi:hypothetical protein